MDTITFGKRLCDYCNESTALLYCRADSAKLCLSCDREVHATNLLFAKHSRSQLCDACDQSPATIFCESDRSVCCQNCDWENHNSLSGSSVHNRRPIEGFNGFVSVSDLMAVFGLDDLENKNGFLKEEFDGCGFDDLADLIGWETTNAAFTIDDLVVSSGSDHCFRAADVPSLPKNRNALCGKQKEEVLRQLCELAKTDHDLSYKNVKPDSSFQCVKQQGNVLVGGDYDPPIVSFPDNEASRPHWLSDNGEIADKEFLQSSVFKSYVKETSLIPCKGPDITISGNIDNGVDNHEDILHVPIATTVFPHLPKHGLNSEERDSAISRYKEKKKMRRYEKHIRYESRKVRAENRKRIKGRFAKLDL